MFVDPNVPANNGNNPLLDAFFNSTQNVVTAAYNNVSSVVQNAFYQLYNFTQENLENNLDYLFKLRPINQSLEICKSNIMPLTGNLPESVNLVFKTIGENPINTMGATLGTAMVADGLYNCTKDEKSKWASMGKIVAGCLQTAGSLALSGDRADRLIKLSGLVLLTLSLGTLSDRLNSPAKPMKYISLINQEKVVSTQVENDNHISKTSKQIKETTQLPGYKS